jgi:hypothetical protein
MSCMQAEVFPREDRRDATMFTLGLVHSITHVSKRILPPVTCTSTPQPTYLAVLLGSQTCHCS